MQYNRITSDTKLTEVLKNLDKRISGVETVGTGSMSWVDENGVETIIGELPDGTVGFQPFVGDTTPPPVPSIPIISVAPGVINISWNGVFVDGADKPVDFQYVNVLGYKIVGGIADPAVNLGLLRNSQETVGVGSDVIAVGETWEFAFSSVDYNKNISEIGAHTAPVTQTSYNTDVLIAEAISSLSDGVSGAQTSADGKSTIYYDSVAPTNVPVGKLKKGDTWFDTANGNRVNTWTGTAWTITQDSTTAQQTADSKGRTYTQDTVPPVSARLPQNLWIDTSAGPGLYVTKYWDGNAWTALKDKDAKAAQDTADAKGETIYSDTEPAAAKRLPQNLWVDTTGGININKRWNGSAWVVVVDSRIPSTAAAVTAVDARVTSVSSQVNVVNQSLQDTQTAIGTTGITLTQSTVPSVEFQKSSNLWIDISLGADKAVHKYWNGSAWTAVSEKAAKDAQTAADSKGEVIYSNSAPAAAKQLPQNLWIDTTGGINIAKRWDGSGWVVTSDSRIDSNAAAVTAVDSRVTSVSASVTAVDTKAQTAINNAAAKGVVLTQSVVPAAQYQQSQNLWNDTSLGVNNTVTKYWDGAAWTAIADKAATDAATLAGSKSAVIYSDTAPTGAAANALTLWIDTTNGANTPKKWVSGTTWTAITDKVATDAATAAATAQKSTSYTINPSFDDWSGTLPDNYTAWSSTPYTKNTTTKRVGQQSLQMSAAANGDNRGIAFGSAIIGHAPNLEYFTVEAEFMLTSGTSLQGAGVLLDWGGLTPQRTAWKFADSVAGTPVLNKWYRVSRVLRRPTTATGTWTGMSGYLMANYSENGTMTAKTMLFDWFNVRPSTAEEILSYNAPTQSQVDKIWESARSYINRGTSTDNILVVNTPAPTVIDSPTAMGGKALQKSGTGNGWWIDLNAKQAFDPLALYKVTARIRVTTPNNVSGAGRFYLGMTGYLADGVTYCNATGANSSSSQHYMLNTTSFAQDGTWVDFVGYVRGNSTGNSGGSGTSSSPTTMHKDVRYIAPLVIMDFSGGNAVMELSHLSMDIVGPEGYQALIDAANAVTTAASDATSKANQAKADAISAAAADATSKANAAQQAAITAAAADATAKAEQAEADAAATAAADATAKANQAKQDAIDAAALTAQLKADGAEQAAIDAAALDAQAKADAAQQAAIEAAALDATAKAEQAEADAAATAAADATAKANQAKQDAINAAAADATAKADAAANRAINSQAYSLNASFDDWTGTFPTGFSNWTGTPVKETSVVRRAPNAIRFSVPDATSQNGVQFTSILAHAPNLEYYTVELDFYLVSGTLGGAGMILDWNGLTNNRAQINLATEFPSPVTGKWYSLTKVLRRPTNSTGTWTSMGGYLMGQWSGHGTGAAKEIIYDWFNIRPSSSEEILAYNAPSDAQTKATQAKNDAISDTNTKLLTKTRTYYQTAKPTGGSYLQGDMWVDSDDGNKVYIYDTTGGFNDFRLAQDANIDKALYSSFPTDFDTAQANKWLYTKYNKTTSASTIPQFTDIVGLAGASSYVNDQASLVSAQGDNYIGQIRTVVNVVSAKTIAFTATHDDGARIYVDGVSVYSAPVFTSNAAISFALSAGWHVIDILWAEQSGGDGITAFSPLLSTQVTNMYAPVSLATVSSIAATASATATNAVTAANGKNKIVFSTSDATGTSYAAGDTWFKKDATTGNIIAVWEFTTSWQPRQLNDSVFSSISAGKIVADWLDVNGQLKANIIDASKLNVTLGGNNLVYNSSFEVDSNADGLADGWNTWARGAGDAGRVFTNTLVAGHFPGSTYAQKVTSTTVTNTEQSSIQGTQLFQIGASQKAVLSLYGRASVAGNFSISLRCEDDAGVYKGDANFTAAFTTTAQRFSGLVVTPAGTTRAKVTITTPGSLANGHWFEVDGIKAELGDVVSAWSPALAELLPGTIVGTMIKADAIDGKTITGPTIQTTATASRGIKLTPTEFAGYDNAGVKNFSLTSGGSLSLMGALTTGSTITGSTVTGSTVQTEVTAARGIKLTTTELAGYDTAGVKNFSLTTAGALTIKGDITSGSTVTGATVTGSTIQTESTASRGIKLTTTELAGYDAAGVKNFSLTTGGTLALKGAIQSGSTITGATLTGAGIETTSTAARGVKIASTGIVTYDASGNMTFKVDAATGLVEAPGLKANSVTANMLASDSIQARHIAIGDFTNLYTSPQHLPETGGVVLGGGATLYSGAEVPPVGLAANIGTRDHISTEKISVRPGDQFYIEFTAKRIAGTAALNAGIWITTSAGGAGTGWSQWEGLNGSMVQIADLGNGWARYKATPSVKGTTSAMPDASWAQLYFQIGQTSPFGTNWLLSDIIWRRRDGGELIVDGAIDGKVITGATVQTTATASRGIKLTAAELAGYDASGNKNFSLDTNGALTLKGAIQSGSTITGATLTGAGIETTATAARGVKIASTGITTYDASGNMTFKVDAATGLVEAPGLKANSISSTMISATAIDGKTITGATVQSESAAQRGIKMTSTEFAGYDTAGVKNFSLLSDGTLTIKGAITSGSTITGATVTGGTVQSEATASRGIKMTSTELAGYDTAGVKNFSLTSAGALTLIGQIKSGSTIEGATLTGSDGIQTSTVANTGVKIANTGIKAYDAANNLTFSVDAATGLVKAPGLEANSITSDMIDTGAIETDHMTAGSINGAVLTAGSVTALELASKSVIADKMVITSTDNIMPEADFSAGLVQWGGVSGAWSVDLTGSRGGTTALKVINDATEQTRYNTKVVPIEAGTSYRISCYVKGSTTLSAGYIGLKVRTTDAAGVQTITKVTSNSATSSASAVWHLLGTLYKMPAGAVKAEFGLYTDATFSTGTAWFDNFMVTRAADGNLVVDGSIDGKTITGALIQTETTASRGLKMDATGLNAYNTAGQTTFSLSATTGKALLTGRILSGAPGEAGLGIIPAAESYNKTQAGIFVTTDGNFPGGIGGMWVNDATTGVAERLQLRGHNDGDVEIAGQNLHIRRAGGRVGNYSNWALGDAANGSNYLPNLQISNTGTAWFRLANAPTTSSSANLIIATNPEGVFYRVSSSIRYKADVQDWDTADRALQLRPRSWVDRKPLDNADPFKRYYGYIAEEVEEHFPEFVVYNDFEEPESVTYDRMPSPATVATLKVFNQRIADLEARLAAAGL